MFVLKFMGSILKVEQDSEISIGPDGVKVTPIGKMLPASHKDPMLDQISSAVGEAVLQSMGTSHRGGRQKDPNSTMQKVLAYCDKLNALGQDFKSIRMQAAHFFKGEKSDKTIDQYCYVWKAQQKKAA